MLRTVVILISLAIFAHAQVSPVPGLYAKYHACREQCLAELGVLDAPVDSLTDVLHFTLPYCRKKCEDRYEENVILENPILLGTPLSNGKGASSSEQDVSPDLHASEHTFFGQFLSRLERLRWPAPDSLENASGIDAAMTLFSIAKAMKPSVVVELGRYAPHSTLALASALRFNSMYDKADVTSNKPMLYSVDLYGAEMHEDLESEGLSTFVQLVYQRPATALTKDLLKSVVADLIVVDGDSSYLYLRDTVALWALHLRSGGYIVIHNNLGRYENKMPDFSATKRYITELQKDTGYEHMQFGAGSSAFTVFRKKK
mmetsp:Transcript_45043/g.73408  ORF Transcript_45043/g.73408 Transcript_45043/m.73408 type:complete len:315 (-) Transcript_45043:2211-3155(-)